MTATKRVNQEEKTIKFGTHCSDCQFWRIVVDVGDADQGCGRVGQAEVQVALHVSGLDDDGVLGYFL